MVRYPLEPLRSLRDAEVDASARELLDESGRTQQAERQVAVARQVVCEISTEHSLVEGSERRRLEDGDAQAGDLAAIATWRVAADQFRAVARERLVEAGQRLEVQRQAEAQARTVLLERRAVAQVVERHRECWAAEQGRRTEQGLEEDATEVWAHHPRRGRE